MFRSTGFRLAAIFTAVFAVSGVLLAVVILLAARASLAEEFDRRLRAEMAAFSQEYDTEGLQGVRDAVQEHDRTPGAMRYGLETAQGAPIVGQLSGAPRPEGWSNAIVPLAGRRLSIRMYTLALPSGDLLSVGDDAERVEALDGVILRSFGWAIAAALVLGALGGWLLGRDLHQRLSALAATAGAIAEGDLSRRASMGRRGDDIDDLAIAFNAMLDRIGELMDSLRQVTTDVAHDLRTPLTRLRQKLEAGLRGDNQDREQVLDSALGDLDSILETFSALLRIAQIEGGARRAAFTPTDLAALARTVVEAFAPSAEEGGRRLTLAAPQPAVVRGDGELLTQMLVNLVENGLRHTPQGSTIAVAVEAGEAEARLRVTDDGPGVPEAERARVFDRFYRLERSRTTPGSGLGLPLAAAVVRLHGGECSLSDAAPGLEVRVVLPRA